LFGQDGQPWALQAGMTMWCRWFLCVDSLQGKLSVVAENGLLFRGSLLEFTGVKTNIHHGIATVLLFLRHLLLAWQPSFRHYVQQSNYDAVKNLRMQGYMTVFRPSCSVSSSV
jgi:hypothetical protein